MFRFISLGVSVLFFLGGALSVGARPCFDRQKDILIAQFDLRPDPGILCCGSALVHFCLIQITAVVMLWGVALVIGRV